MIPNNPTPPQSNLAAPATTSASVRNLRPVPQLRTDVAALIKLWNVTQIHPGTSGALAALSVLLGLYNGSRFPMDLTKLRTLDDGNFQAAISVITSDCRFFEGEVHYLLNLVTGRHDFGDRLENLASDYRLKGRGLKKNMRKCSPAVLVL
ncbi:MAG: hypothetical protein V4684_06160 [Pseudomonadota bacterium]